MITDTDPDKILEIHKRMIDKSVRVLEGNASWVGRVVDVIDTENFSVRKGRESTSQAVSVFNIRSL
tara:strand:+ start:1588 stop:1785 length:198 start_codon:yes stop_codon:yes gene_type:complete